jgi:hypothetical protein
MRKIPALFFTAISGLVVAGSMSATQAGSSIWNHNGSQMLLEANGNQRTLSYLYPRRGLSARAGDMVFQGRRVGNTYVGTAYTFRRGCPPAPYQVSGRLRSETRIVLTGAAPVRRGCAVVDYTRRGGNARLVFSFMRKTGEQGYGTDSDEPPQARPQQQGPVEGPVQRITKKIPGGRIIFRIQDEDAPAETPIRMDATARCFNGRAIKVMVNRRTCQFDGIRTLRDGSGFDLMFSNFGGGTCSRPDQERIQTYDLCQ